MASILETAAYLVFGGAIGWWIKRRFFAPVFTESDTARLSREWKDHLDAHAKAMEGSVTLTPAPPCLVEFTELDIRRHADKVGAEWKVYADRKRGLA